MVVRWAIGFHVRHTGTVGAILLIAVIGRWRRCGRGGDLIFRLVGSRYDGLFAPLTDNIVIVVKTNARTNRQIGFAIGTFSPLHEFFPIMSRPRPSQPV